jgi:hypothetical protein
MPPAPSVNIVQKLSPPLTDAATNKARVFQFVQMFTIKARSSPLECGTMRCFTRVGQCLTHQRDKNLKN